jgi:hypothetical protein
MVRSDLPLISFTMANYLTQHSEPSSGCSQHCSLLAGSLAGVQQTVAFPFGEQHNEVGDDVSEASFLIPSFGDDPVSFVSMLLSD